MSSFAKANALFRKNELEKAAKMYKKAISENSEIFFFYENLGRVYERMGNSREADKWYEESKKLHSSAVRAGCSSKPRQARVNPSPSKSESKSKKKDEIHPVDQIRDAVQKIDVEPLKAEYYRRSLDKIEDDFVLVRVIGNDLYPRHKKGQTRENIRFILENEPSYDGCKKLWLVNRIFDPNEHTQIIAMLEQFGQDYVDVPFVESEYRALTLDTDVLPSPGFLSSQEYQLLGPEQKERIITALYRLKNNYVMNNNGARNLALREGKKRAKWVLPWDGNCYLTPDAWNQIRQDVTSSPWYTHFVVPMARMLSNDDLINNVAPPDPVEEPQLIFRGDTECYFNEDYCYGRRPKVEFFWGIGIPGKWDRWKDDPWDIPRRSNLVEQQQFGLAGWVARLYSGMGNLEKDSAESFRNRGLARQEAIVSTLRHIDKKLNPGAANKSSLQIYSTEKIRELAKSYKAGKTSRLADSILQDAEEALTRGPFSVVDKTTLPPSGDPHDYWHPAPYWWPNPDTPDGLPYIRRDGERVPGTRLYEPDSDKYDRSRIQRVFDDSISLALAWKVSGEDKYIAHAADILKRFFVEPATRMNPHLNYAQVRMGINKNNGASTGLIEFKDLYYYLDAVRIIEQSGALSAEDIGSFSSWLSDYKTWLMESAQGLKESRGLNNHGTYYDLHLAAVAAYLGDESTLYETFARAQGRIVEQITPDGRQPNELGRKTSAHYCCYNLQGFLNLAKYAKNWGVDIWGYRSRSGSSLKGAVNWLVGYWGKEWPFEQIDPFDKERILALQFTALRMDMSADSARREMGNLDVKPRFFPHDGIQPYWELL